LVQKEIMINYANLASGMLPTLKIKQKQMNNIEEKYDDILDYIENVLNRNVKKTIFKPFRS